VTGAIEIEISWGEKEFSIAAIFF